MPRLNREVIRQWLAEHNWSTRWLAEERGALGTDRLTDGVIRNAVNGIDPMHPGRIHLIRQVTEKYGDGIPYGRLVAEEDDGHRERGAGDCRAQDRQVALPETENSESVS
jgi:hypothetical protein